MLIMAAWQERAFVSAQLQEEGYRIKAFAGFNTAVAFLCRSPRMPDVVVLDTHRLHLPVDRLSDFRMLLGDIPLILCTGPYRIGELDLGALRPAKVLIRPFSVEEVAEAVKEVLASSPNLC